MQGSSKKLLVLVFGLLSIVVITVINDKLLSTNARISSFTIGSTKLTKTTDGGV